MRLLERLVELFRILENDCISVFALLAFLRSSFGSDLEVSDIVCFKRLWQLHWSDLCCFLHYSGGSRKY